MLTTVWYDFYLYGTNSNKTEISMIITIGSILVHFLNLFSIHRNLQIFSQH